MQRVMMGLVLATTMGCATVGKVGANTTNYRTWWKDCGVSRDVPSNIGQGVEVADLIPEPAEITPAAVAPKIKFKVVPVNPKDWNE